jgi:hypothetical protein
MNLVVVSTRVQRNELILDGVSVFNRNRSPPSIAALSDERARHALRLGSQRRRSGYLFVVADGWLRAGLQAI